MRDLADSLLNGATAAILIAGAAAVLGSEGVALAYIIVGFVLFTAAVLVEPL